MADPSGPEPEQDPAYVQFARSTVWALQFAAFAALALGPLVAGFVVPLGPPQYHLSIDGVGPATDATDPVAYGDLSAESRALFDEAFESPDDAVAIRTDDPAPILERDRTHVLRGDVAFRTSASRDQPLRPVAILAGLLGSTLTTLLGASITERDPVWAVRTREG